MSMAAPVLFPPLREGDPLTRELAADDLVGVHEERPIAAVIDLRNHQRVVDLKYRLVPFERRAAQAGAIGFERICTRHVVAQVFVYHSVELVGACLEADPNGASAVRPYCAP